MKLFRIALANIKKKKKAVASIIVLVLIAVLFLNSGFKLSTGIDEFYRNKCIELKAPHILLLLSNNSYKNEYLEFFQRDSRTAELEYEEVAMLNQATTYYDGGTIDVAAVVMNADTKADKKIAPLILTEQMDIPEEEAIYIPVGMKGYGYQLGGTFKIGFQKRDYLYKVAGFYETTYFGGADAGCFKYYLKDAAYRKLYDSAGGGKLISVRLENKDLISMVEKDFYESTSIRDEISDTLYNKVLTEDMLKTGGTMANQIFGAVMIAFAVIITTILLLVIRFRIHDTIQDNITNIGALGAMGYTSREISLSVMLEFVLIGGCGILFGTIFSYVIMPVISQVIGNSSGLQWKVTFRPAIDILCAVILAAVICTTALKSAGKVRKYPPVIALRKGIANHSFRKNYFPLHQAFCPVNGMLTLKTFMSEMKQNITIAIIIAGVTFISVFSFIFYANFALDTSKVYEMVGMEVSDVQLKLMERTDKTTLLHEIESLNQVRKVLLSDQAAVTVDGVEIQVIIAEDFSQMEMLSVYEGRLPVYDNEIAINGVAADKIGKSIGDTVIVDKKGIELQYIITGMGQSMNNNGMQGEITTKGINRLIPDFHMKVMNIYLKEGVNTEEFINWIYNHYKIGNQEEISGAGEGMDQYTAVKQKADKKIARLLSDYGIESLEYALMVDGKVVLTGGSWEYKIKEVTNMRKWGDGQLMSYASLLEMLVAIMVVSTAIIISLILSLIIKSTIRKRRQEFGIYKAIGFTTYQLMTQLAAGFIPAAVVGAAAGGIIGALTTNQILGYVFYRIGISKLEFGIEPLLVVGICFAIIVFTYLSAMVMSLPIRKISVYHLLTD